MLRIQCLHKAWNVKRIYKHTEPITVKALILLTLEEQLTFFGIMVQRMDIDFDSHI